MTILGFACVALLALPASASAAIEVESFSLSASTAQAGTHPDLTLKVSFAQPSEPETARNVFVQLPAGLFLYPWTVPRCGSQQLAADECPLDSQVGVIDLHEAGFGSLEKTPVYLTAPAPDEVARLAFHSLGFTEPVEVSVRAGAADGYSLSLAFEELPETLPISSLELLLWGVPPAASHDEERGPHASEIPGGRPSAVPPTPFTRNPTACGATSASVAADSYVDPGEWSMASASGPTVIGCDKLAFEPAAAFALSSEEAASGAGIGLEYQLPQDLLPNDRATSDTAAIALYLPPDLAVDEASAAQHTICTPAEANLGSEAPAACPLTSKIGSFDTALAGGDGTLEGSVYFGGAESPGGYRLILAGSGGGLNLKLSARLSPGGETELVIPELPQLPLESLDFQIDPAANLFTTPPQCGTFAAVAEAIDWSAPGVASLLTTPFQITSGPGGGPCPSPSAEEGEPSTPPPGNNAPPSPTPASTTPTVTLRKHPPHHGHDRTPTFAFTSSVPGSSFLCKIDRRPWRPCRSPLTLRKLTLGRHAFRVKAVTADGTESPPLTYRFDLRRT